MLGVRRKRAGRGDLSLVMDVQRDLLMTVSAVVVYYMLCGGCVCVAAVPQGSTEDEEDDEVEQDEVGLAAILVPHWGCLWTTHSNNTQDQLRKQPFKVCVFSNRVIHATCAEIK